MRSEVLCREGLNCDLDYNTVFPYRWLPRDRQQCIVFQNKLKEKEYPYVIMEHLHTSSFLLKIYFIGNLSTNPTCVNIRCFMLHTEMFTM
jgi:hypothetical protein